MADLWSWFDNLLDTMRQNGEGDIARRTDQYLMDCYEGRLEKGEAAYPSLLLYARSKKNVWLEIFLRHWLLQLRYQKNYKMGESLNEALELLQLTKSEDAKGCPQSICAVQDLARCYSARDETGSAEIVLQVASETFETLTRDIPCYKCVGAEKAYALRLCGRAEEAMDLINEVYYGSGGMRKNDPNKGEHFYKHTIKVFYNAYYELDDHEEVLRLYNDYMNSRHAQEPYNATVALSHIQLGEFQKAAEILEPFDFALKQKKFSSQWGEAIEKLVRQGTIDNTTAQTEQLRQAASIHEKNGMWRTAFNLYHNAAQIALLRNAYDIASLCLQDMERALPELVKPMGADKDIENLKTAIQARSENKSPDKDNSNSHKTDIGKNHQRLRQLLRQRRAVNAFRKRKKNIPTGGYSGKR